VADELHVVGVTADGRLLHAIRRRDGDWQEFRDVGRAAGRPGEVFVRAGAAVAGGDLHVCATDKDGRLWHTIRTPGGEWQAFRDAGREARAPGAFADVVCAGPPS
jgi:hypothetical protein